MFICNKLYKKHCYNCKKQNNLFAKEVFVIRSVQSDY
nr:MAG TPA: hypothetical protein [Caudoviricetes sp.]